MASVSSISLSGMNAAQTQLNVAAHNVANLNTEGFSRQQVALSEQPTGGVSAAVTTASQPGSALETDIVSELQAKYTYMANLSVFKTSSKMAGALLDLDA
jgi:flagellar basal body rod protein FlgG